MKIKIDKDLIINPFPLSDKEVEQVLNVKTTSLDEKQLNEVIFLIDLCDSVAIKRFDVEDSFEWAVRGLRQGLMHYRDEDHKKDKKIKLTTYITWFMNDFIDRARDEVKTK